MIDSNNKDLKARLEAVAYIIKNAEIMISRKEALRIGLKLSDEELDKEYINAYYNYDCDPDLSKHWATLSFRTRYVSRCELLNEYKRIIEETVANKVNDNRKRK